MQKEQMWILCDIHNSAIFLKHKWAFPAVEFQQVLSMSLLWVAFETLPTFLHDFIHFSTT